MDNTTTITQCHPASTGKVVIGLMFIAMPFHILISYTFAKDSTLFLPRHRILLCLSISHGFQLTVPFVSIVIMKSGSLHAQGTPCQVMRSIVQFSTGVTIVVSSFTLIALSMERYIACIHGARLHQIVTNQRVTSLLVGFWFLGAVSGGLIFIGKKKTVVASTILSDTPNIQILIVVITFPTCLILIFVQTRLFIVSRRQITRVMPGMAGRRHPEQNNMGRRQIKVAVIAGIVIISYVTLIIPSACHVAVNIVSNGLKPSPVKKNLTILWTLNAIIDPLVYGLGMKDVRTAIIRQIKRIHFFGCLIP
ncbi:melanocyte-stimulating hormone receptor-like [Rhopilema esculentum]|uniref:melanocyte-stimulating hormone receptor-like n=1 Tax=Rhopilema esculentum TaxID=499914 RepID=UPI0031DA5211|eukprot:gene16785-8245_t